MAYAYSEHESHWWAQQCYPMPYCQPIPAQDEQWMVMDFFSNAPEQKYHGLQTQSNLISERHLMPNFQSSYDYDHSMRTVSPTISHYSSSLSDFSASSEPAPIPNDTSRSAPFTLQSTVFTGQHIYTLSDIPVQQHMIWQPRPHHSYAVVQPQSHFSLPIPAQSPLPMSEIEMVQHSEETSLGVDVRDQDNEHHAKSPTYMPQPQEVEYSEGQDDSAMSSPTEDLSVTTPTSDIIEARICNDETEEEEDEEPLIVDNDSDSDYDNRRPHRRTSRTTPRQRHVRKTSNNTIIAQISRIHKRTSSSTTTSSTTSPSLPRGQSSRSSSKSFKKRPKGPNFPSNKIPIPIPKSERTYPCTFHRFGCTSEFPNKNEWKRHVACQHLQLGYYRCDIDGCDPDTCPSTSSKSRHGRRSSGRSRSRPEDSDSSTGEIVKSYNDFNRKDLFTQHCRRMHGPTRNPALCSRPPKKDGELCPTKEDEAAFEVQLAEIRTRCWHVRRPAPSRSSCGFCQELFDADFDPPSSTSTAGNSARDSEGNEEKKWEERMEHVGKHYEKEGADREEEGIDEDLVEWGLRTGVLRELPDGRPWLASIEDPNTQAQGDDTAMNIDTSSGSRTGGGLKARSSGEYGIPRRKARRQPSRTVVIQRRVSFKEEDIDDSTVVVKAIKSEY